MKWKDYIAGNKEILLILKYKDDVGYFDVVASNHHTDSYEKDKTLLLMYLLSGTIMTTASYNDLYRILLGKVKMPSNSKLVGLKICKGKQI